MTARLEHHASVDAFANAAQGLAWTWLQGKRTAGGLAGASVIRGGRDPGRRWRSGRRRRCRHRPWCRRGRWCRHRSWRGWGRWRRRRRVRVRRRSGWRRWVCRRVCGRRWWGRGRGRRRRRAQGCVLHRWSGTVGGLGRAGREQQGDGDERTWVHVILLAVRRAKVAPMKSSCLANVEKEWRLPAKSALQIEAVAEAVD